jgi:apolipoprotein N-acyltransferase
VIRRFSTTLLADVPTTHDRTLYMLLGDWFAWLSVAVFALALIAEFGSRQ